MSVKLDSCRKVYQQATALTSSTLFHESIAMVRNNPQSEHHAYRPMAVREWAGERIHDSGDIAGTHALSGDFQYEPPQAMSM